MHKIQEKEFTLEDFSTEHLFEVSTALKEDIAINEYPYLRKLTPIEVLNDTISILNVCRKKYLAALKTEPETGLPAKNIWWQMIQLLPSSYNQTRNVMMNYEVLANIYKSRKNHKLDEWREICKWIEELPYSELITCENSRGLRSIAKIVDEICDSPLEQVFKEYEADERRKIIKCKDCVYFDDEFCKATKQRARGWEFCDFAKKRSIDDYV